MPGIPGSTYILVYPAGLLEQSELWGGQLCVPTKLRSELLDGELKANGGLPVFKAVRTLTD